MDLLVILLIILVLFALVGGATVHNLIWILAAVLIAVLIFHLVSRNRRV